MDKVHSEERRFTPEGIEIDIGADGVCVYVMSVCEFVQGLSLIAPDRRSRSGRDKHHSMRQSAGTTDGVGHVAPRATWLVPRPAAWTLSKTTWAGHFFRRDGRRDP